MKIYWVTGHDQYYPLGGLDNVKATFETYEEAVEYVEEKERLLNHERNDFYYIHDVRELLGI